MSSNDRQRAYFEAQWRKSAAKAYYFRVALEDAARRLQPIADAQDGEVRQKLRAIVADIWAELASE